MKIIWRYFLGVCILVSLVISIGICSSLAESSDISGDYFWSATSASSGYYVFNVAIAELLNKEFPKLNITVIESGGAADNLHNIETGQASFAQCAEPDLYEAQHGIGTYKNNPFEESRLLFLACPLAYYFTVSERSGISSLSELSGKDYSPGLSGSTTELISYEILENILGYTPKWYPASTGEAVNAMKDRRIDGFTKSGPTNSPDSSLQDVATSLPIKVLSFNKQEQDKIIEKFPYYRFTTINGSLYNQKEDIESVGIFFCAIVDKDIPEDVVYHVITTIMDNQDYIAEAFAGIKNVNMVELTANYSVSYMHPGLIKYLKEKGYTVRDEQIPPEIKK